MYEDDAELANLFAYHPPTNPEVIRRHELVRELANKTAQSLNSWLPDSREKTIALTKIQEAMWAANAAVAIHMNNKEDQ